MIIVPSISRLLHILQSIVAFKLHVGWGTAQKSVQTRGSKHLTTYLRHRCVFPERE